MSVVKKILSIKTAVSEELNKTDKCLHQIVLFVARKKINVH